MFQSKNIQLDPSVQEASVLSDSKENLAETIIDAIQKLSIAEDLETIMFIVRKAARKLTSSDGATFVLRQGNECYYAAEDAIAPLWQGKRFPMSICVSGWVMEHKESLIIEDIYADPRVPHDAYRPTFVKSLAMVPIRNSDPIGAIGVYWAEHYKPTNDQLKFLKSLADSTSVAMENIRLRKELEKGNQETITNVESTKKLIETNKQLENILEELNDRQKEMQLLKELSSKLQTCISIDEAYHFIAQSIMHIFPGVSGNLFLLHASRNYLESVVDWGDFPSDFVIIKPDDCLALRHGTTYFVEHLQNEIFCKHFKQNNKCTSYACIPLAAQSDMIGLLHLEWQDTLEKPNAIKNRYNLANVVGEQIAISIANIKLRETLRNQSVRDLLTGLYNRRYLEETLEREIARCNRSSSSIAIIMIDIDHFKLFNDEYGHNAGDAVLKKIAVEFKKFARTGSDLVCRYGGEEFMVVLPEITTKDAIERIDSLRNSISDLQLFYKKTLLRKVTVSAGISFYPMHGEKINTLIHNADIALYHAKKAGRNQVKVYENKHGSN